MNSSCKKILIVGASSDLARPLNEALSDSDATLGLHYNRNKTALSKYKENESIKKFKENLNSLEACYELIGNFVSWAGGIDCLIQLSGDIHRPVYWENLVEKDWQYDLSCNLIMPFFLAQRAASFMKQKGGRIILTSTSSARHGGGSNSLAYGVAKAGVECVIKRMARDCAKYNILVNAIAPGFIPTKFHTERMKRREKELRERVKSVPLKRAGRPEDVSGAIMFLLSDSSSYVTGQVIAIDGGDWL